MWSYGKADCSAAGEGLSKERACAEAQSMATEQGETWAAWEAHEGGETIYFEPVAVSFQVQVRGTFGGSTDGWRPAITGTLNQSGLSDDEASTTESYGEAQEMLGLVQEAGARVEDTRVIEVEEAS